MDTPKIPDIRLFNVVHWQNDLETTKVYAHTVSFEQGIAVFQIFKLSDDRQECSILTNRAFKNWEDIEEVSIPGSGGSGTAH